MRRPRTSRILPACVALAMLSGCFGPPTSPVAPSASRRPGGGTGMAGDPGSSSAAPGTPPPAAIASAGPLGLVPSVLPAASLPPPPVSAVSGKPVIQGVVRIPAKIISNNGGSIIGQNGANLISDNGAVIIGNNGANVIGNNGANVIGQNGASVIGQNGASVIGQNGASVIGQNGANIIGNNGAGVIGQNGASLKFTQYRVANAKVVVKDAAGQPLKDESGKPVETTTDATGSYELPAGVVPSNAIIEVTSPDLAGNTLAAYLPSDAAMVGAAIDVDIASTLVINYVRDQYVKGDQSQLDKLPRTIADEAKLDLAHVLEEADFQDVKVVAAAQVEAVVGAAIAASTEVSEVFDRIKKIYVFAGVTDNGDGLLAEDFLVGEVAGLYKDEQGFLVLNSKSHNLFSVTPAGLIKTVVQSGDWGITESPGINNKVGIDVHAGVLRDGQKIIVADPVYNRVVAVNGGQVSVVLGTGVKGSSPAGLRAHDTDLDMPSGLALQPNGRLCVADRKNHRVLRVETDGTTQLVVGGGTESELVVGMPASDIRLAEPQGLATNLRGHLFVCDFGNDRLLQLTPTGAVGYQLENFWDIDSPIAVGMLHDTPIVASHLMGKVFRLNSAGAEDVPFEQFSENNASIDPNWRVYSPNALATFGGDLFIVDFGSVREFLFDRKTTSIVFGAANRANSFDTFSAATKFDVSATGEIVIADMPGKKIFLLDKDGKSKCIVAAAPHAGFEESSNNPLTAAMTAPFDAKWRADGAIIFSVGGDRPCVKCYKDGQITTLVGTGRMSYDAFVPGKANQVKLASPRCLLVEPDGTLLILEPDAGRLLSIDGAGQVRAIDLGTNVSGYISFKRSDGGAYVAVNRAGQNVVKLKSGTSEILCTYDDLGIDKSVEFVRTAIFAANGDLYVATNTSVYRRMADATSIGKLAGRGSEILNGATRDESILDLRDLLFAPNGDLLILEGNQVKRISKDKL